MINNKERFMFIHIPKNGGTSVSSRLKKIHGSESFKGGYLEGIGWSQHMTASEAYSLYPEAIDYYTFAFVRNPFERLVSQYLWRIVKHGNWIEEGINISKYGERPGWTTEMIKGASFRSFVLELIPCDEVSYEQHMKPQVEFTHKDGRQIVDFVGRLETLKQDWFQVCDRIGLIREPLPKLNATKQFDYREFYTPDLRATVEDRYRLDLRTFGYRF